MTYPFSGTRRYEAETKSLLTRMTSLSEAKAG
jgi:hypothetical protein